jgi:16S rRNA (cytidine1402-2'-O)-methyltransferase
MKRQKVAPSSLGGGAQTGTLYLVPTPLGNWGDMTCRALEILRTCDAIACETPTVARKLLQHFQIPPKPIFVYRDAGEIKSAAGLMDRLQKGCSLALVGDAGTPNISDPGFRLVNGCRKRGIPVVALPGPCAAITALSASGLPTDKFIFLGFLSPKGGPRRRMLETYLRMEVTLIIYESPFRLISFLALTETLVGPHRIICLAHEISKCHESYHFGRLGEVRREIELLPRPKGEYVVLVAPEKFSEIDHPFDGKESSS